MAYAPIMLLIGLGGCAVAREEARLTFNDHILQPGEPRAEVERAFGKPDSVVDRNGREVVRYSTSKVDDGARHKLASSRAGIDLFTLGAFEIADPVAMSEDERKIFTITYQDGLILGPVLVVCAAQGKERTYFPGFTCTETVRM